MARGTMSHRAFPWIAGGVIVLDQLSKWWVQQSMALNAYRTLLLCPPCACCRTGVRATSKHWLIGPAAAAWAAQPW